MKTQASHARSCPARAGGPRCLRRGPGVFILLAAVLICSTATGAARAQDATDAAVRQQMVERAQQYLFHLAANGDVGDTRKPAVTALFVLASLSSGYLPDDAQRGPTICKAVDWILQNSSAAFLGGAQQPNADHALANLMLVELMGQMPSPQQNRNVYSRGLAAFEYSLQVQDRGVGAEYYGGWKPNDQTRVNDRILTGWYLQLLHAGQLRGLEASKSAVSRALAFMSASQKPADHPKPEERGGFSVDVQGLPVSSTTAAGLAALALFGPEEEKPLAAAGVWLSQHPPTWHGPNFYETNFFAVRGLYRTRQRDGGKAYAAYFRRLIQMLKDRQEADGSFPFPPGHGKPIVEMGPGYSTALGVLILNVDRGLLPMDR